jgi:hypothetical protein
LDPLDAAALAAGEPPVLAADAAEHLRGCPSCAGAVSEARSFSLALDELAGAPEAPVPLGAEGPDRAAETADLADRVLCLRPFSRRERRDLRLWRGPLLLSLAFLLSGLVCLALPGISAREQAGLAAAALGPLAALLISAGRSLAELVRVGPAGLGALSEVLQAQRALGFVFLLLLVPAFFGLTRALARSRR